MIYHIMFYHFAFDRPDKDRLKIAFEIAVNQYTGKVLSTDILIEDVANEPIQSSPDGNLILYGFQYENVINVNAKNIEQFLIFY